MELGKELQGVIPDSPPGEPEPNEPEGNEGDGRDIENVRREMLRKMDNRFGEFDNQMEQLMQAVSKLTAQKPSTNGTDQLENMSADELAQLRSNVPEEKLGEFDALVQQKRNKEYVDTRFQQLQMTQKTHTERHRFNKMAVDRYPDLSDPDSDFAQEVDRQLRSVDPELRDRNPRVVYDIANDVAMSRGVSPQIRRTVRATAPTNTGPAEKANQDVQLMSDERREELKRRLQSSLPKGGKFDDDDLKDTEKFIQENQHLYTSGGKKG